MSCSNEPQRRLPPGEAPAGSGGGPRGELSRLDSPTAGVQAPGGRGLTPTTLFCPVGSRGHDSQPLRRQLPSPRGVVQVRGKAPASEAPVRPRDPLHPRPPLPKHHPSPLASRSRAALQPSRDLTYVAPAWRVLSSVRSRDLGAPAVSRASQPPADPCPSFLPAPRLVNSCLSEELQHIHAFEQKTLTPEQWANEKPK